MQYEIKWNNTSCKNTCVRCGADFKPAIGVEAFLAGTWDPICNECFAEHQELMEDVTTDEQRAEAQSATEELTNGYWLTNKFASGLKPEQVIPGVLSFVEDKKLVGWLLHPDWNEKIPEPLRVPIGFYRSDIESSIIFYLLGAELEKIAGPRSEDIRRLTEESQADFDEYFSDQLLAYEFDQKRRKLLDAVDDAVAFLGKSNVIEYITQYDDADDIPF